MKTFKISLLAISILVSVNCQSKSKQDKIMRVSEVKEIEKPKNIIQQNANEYATAYFASGCFWCVEAIFESVKGVKEVISGYSGGTEENPTYEQVGGGYSSHAEAVKVYYNPKVISFSDLVTVFFGSHDPTTLNRQGPDSGRQYRSIAFYKNEQEKDIIKGYIKDLIAKNVYNGATITTEVTKFTKFYNGEDYHQDYEKKHPYNPYIINVSIPRLNRFKKNFKEYLKDDAHWECKLNSV